MNMDITQSVEVMSMNKHKKSKNKVEQVRGLIDQAVARLAAALDQGESDTLKRYLAMVAKFHRYSADNSLLIWGQRPDATRVAGFQAWKRLGRTVRKGEKGIAILAPRKNGCCMDSKQRTCLT